MNRNLYIHILPEWRTTFVSEGAIVEGCASIIYT